MASTSFIWMLRPSLLPWMNSLPPAITPSQSPSPSKGLTSLTPPLEVPFFPLNHYNNFINSINTDTESATSIFAHVVRTLNHFFMQTSNNIHWKQCSHCLNVSNANTTSDNLWEATLLSCHQDVDAVRTTILN